MGVSYIVIGDFNEIRNPTERKDYMELSRSIVEFDEWTNDMGLVELPLLGRKFTWK